RRSRGAPRAGAGGMRGRRRPAALGHGDAPKAPGSSLLTAALLSGDALTTQLSFRSACVPQRRAGEDVPPPPCRDEGAEEGGRAGASGQEIAAEDGALADEDSFDAAIRALAPAKRHRHRPVRAVLATVPECLDESADATPRADGTASPAGPSPPAPLRAATDGALEGGGGLDVRDFFSGWAGRLRPQAARAPASGGGGGAAEGCAGTAAAG
ncbi:unnamed protein product, partial [Prorocentrum cordatum]